MFSKFLLFLFLTNKNRNFKNIYNKKNENEFKFNNIHSNLLLNK